MCVEEGQDIRYYSFRDTAHSSLKEKGLHVRQGLAALQMLNH